MTTYHLHGLLVDSDIALHAPVADYPGAAEVSIRRVEDMVVPTTDAGRTLFERDVDSQAWHRVISLAGATWVSFAEVATFRISTGNDSIEYVWHNEEPGLGPILLEGYVLALLLTLRGRCVLHASAVALADGRALAIVGPSGSGKSTLSLLLAARGRPHLADDVVSVDLSVPGLPKLSSGSRSIRLRAKAWDLQTSLPDASASHSFDQRLVLEDKSATAGDFELAALWLPRPDIHVASVEIERVAPGDAFQHLLPNFRVELNDAPHRRRSFENAVDIARTVPMYIVRVPWGPPWNEESFASLAKAAKDICVPTKANEPSSDA